MKRRKRRLQEKIRRLKRSQQKQQANIRQFVKALDSGVDLTQLGDGVTRCAACGLEGHMKTNRNCPFYVARGSDAVSKVISADVPNIKKGLVLKIKKEVLTASENRPLSPPSTPSTTSKPSPSLKRKKRKYDSTEEEEGEVDLGDEVEEGDEGDMVSEPAPYKRSRGNKRSLRSSAGAVVELGNLLREKVLDPVLKLPNSEPFAHPVDSRVAPDYYKVVSEPMDLNEIRYRLNHGSYNSSKEFMADVNLIKDNCIAYNSTRWRNLIPMVESVVQLIEQNLSAHAKEILELEKLIEQEVLEGQRDENLRSSQKKKLKKSKKSVGAPENSTQEN